MVMDLFDRMEALREFFDKETMFSGLPVAGRGTRAYPRVNLYESGENFYVEVAAPGAPSDQLELTAMGRALTIAGRKLGLDEIQAERIHRNERAAGNFVRTISLPADIEPERVSAEFSRGLLMVTLPRAESSKPRRITVRTELGGRENGQ